MARITWEMRQELNERREKYEIKLLVAVVVIIVLAGIQLIYMLIFADSATIYNTSIFVMWVALIPVPPTLKWLSNRTRNDNNPTLVDRKVDAFKRWLQRA